MHVGGYVNNTNFIGSDGLVHNIYIGDQTVNTLKKAQDKLINITTKLRSEKKPILVLTDIRQIGNVNIQARRFGVDFIKNVDFDKVAIFGNPSFIKLIANFIIIASGRGFKMKYFDTEKEAKTWLLKE